MYSMHFISEVILVCLCNVISSSQRVVDHRHKCEKVCLHPGGFYYNIISFFYFNNYIAIFKILKI